MAKKVLIVEDYDDIRDFMQLLVESYGYQTLTTASGKEAVEIAKKEVPDLILMDIALPDIDGITATRLIREQLKEIEVPIVAVTASGRTCYQEALQAGCNKVISKPVEIDSLEPVLSQYLEC